MHGSCKFNKFYQIRENKMCWVQHRSKPLMTTTTDTNVVTECTLLAIVLLIALYYIVSDEIKCAGSGLSCDYSTNMNNYLAGLFWRLVSRCVFLRRHAHQRSWRCGLALPPAIARHLLEFRSISHAHPLL